MNREQSFVLSNLYIEYHPLKSDKFRELYNSVESKPISWTYGKGKNIDDGKFIIRQSDSYETEGTIVLIAYGISSVKVSGGEFANIVNAVKNLQKIGMANVVIIDFDVNNPVTKLTLKYDNNLVDDIDITVEFVNKPKVFIDPRIKLIENMCIKHSTGEHLVNIYFQMAHENVENTIVELYVCDGTPNSSSNIVKNRQLMLNKIIEKGTFYTSIKDLAFGIYSYKVEQRDKNSNVIVVSDYFDFQIKKPNYGAKPVISNRDR